MTLHVGWEREAHDWIAWARTPGHDAYWYYRDAFLELVPPPGRAALEVGCGEGRVCRDLARRGHAVTGLDASPTLLAAAREADPTGTYLVADAAALPFADASFDLVVAYNSLMDVEDMPRTLAEAARVLERRGRLCVCVTHPLSDAGTFESDDPAAPFVIRGSYLARRRCEAAFERDGLAFTFRGWCYPLEAYARALEDADLLIETMREPVPARHYRAYDHRARIPNFLMLRALKP